MECRLFLAQAGLPLESLTADVRLGMGIVVAIVILMGGGLGILSVVVRRLRRSLLAEQAALRESQAVHAELAETYSAVQRFVPYEFLSLVGRQSIRHIKRGDARELQLEVIFCDLRGFSGLVEGLAPREAYGLVNAYLAAVEPALHVHGGFVNQYLGDCILALFPTGADAALSAVTGMQRALDSFNSKRSFEGHLHLDVGFGVSGGPLMLGTIGGGTRLDQAVIGHDVNLAARLEGLTTVYGARALVSGRCVSRLEDPTAVRLRLLDRICAKGMAEPVDVYELVDALPAELQRLRARTADHFDAALRAYRSRAFSDALDGFEQCLMVDSGDLAASVYMDRCRRMMIDPPEADWGAVSHFSHK